MNDVLMQRAKLVGHYIDSSMGSPAGWARSQLIRYINILYKGLEGQPEVRVGAILVGPLQRFLLTSVFRDKLYSEVCDDIIAGKYPDVDDAVSKVSDREAMMTWINIRLLTVALTDDAGITDLIEAQRGTKPQENPPPQ